MEVVSVVTSLRPERATPGRWLAWVRGQWQMENQVHWVREVTCDARRFPWSEMLQPSGMRLHSFCPENRMTCDGKVDRFIVPREWLSQEL